MNTILLTGATGFLGSNLFKSLLKNTTYDIIILKRSFSSTNRIETELKDERVRSYDIDCIEIESVFKKEKIDIVIHCATKYGRNEKNASISIMESNVIFPLKLLEESIRHNVLAFINTDTYFCKGDSSYSYLFNYSLSKKIFNMWLQHYSRDIKIINLVLEHIYGENDNADKFISWAFRSIVTDKVEHINLTGGEQKRDFVYIDDACKAYLLAVEYSFNHKFKYKSFNVGTGKSISVRTFIETIKKESHSQTILNFGVLPYREDEIMLSRADITDLEDIGYFPRYDYIAGIQNYIKNIAKQGD